LYIGKMDR